MTVPGSNLLNRAFNLIARQSFDYYAFIERTPDDAGLLVASYATAQSLRGSIQPVARRMYEAMGLDFQKNYYNIYVSQKVLDVRRDVSGDYVNYNGQKFQCESITDWFAADGWAAVLAVQVQNG